MVEISTPKGLAYAQYLLTERLGDLIRVLPGEFADRPASLADVVSAKERFWVFFPLRAALARKLVTKVGSEPLPEHARRMPVMRMAGARDATGTVLDWWLYDGQREWRIGKELRPEQRQMSLARIVNDTMLIEDIVEGWTPSQET